MSALSNLYAAAEDIRTLLMPFAFLLCVLGIGEMGWRAGSDARAVLGALLRTIIVVALIAGYPSAMKTGQQAFIEMRSKFTTARDAKFVQLLSSRIQNQPSDSWTNLGKIVPAAIGYFFQGIGRFMLILLRFFQEFAIAGLIAVSPLLIGFLFFSYTQSLALQFGVTSLTVLLWHVAICLVDIVIQAISDTLFMPITANNLVQVGANLIVVNNWLMFPFIMAFASFLTVFFYLSVPFVASAVMKGLSGTTATLQAGVQGAMQTAGVIVGAGLTAAGAAATFGGSAAVQAAIEGTKTAAEGATAAGGLPMIFRVQADSRRAHRVRKRRCVRSSRSAAACARHGWGKPFNPAQVAHQTTPFVHRDGRGAGTISHHKGNIFAPYAAQAAFNRIPRRRNQATAAAADDQTRMKFSAVAAITNNLVAARFWMILAILFAGMAVASPYFTVMAMRAREKVVILDPGGTLIYAPLLGLRRRANCTPTTSGLPVSRSCNATRSGRICPTSLKRLYLEPARKKAAAMYQARNPEFKERRFTRRSKSRRLTSSTPARSRTGRSFLRGGHRAHRRQSHPHRHAQQMEFREPVKFSMEFLFIRNPDLLGNGRLPLVVQDFKYKETPL